MSEARDDLERFTEELVEGLGFEFVELERAGHRNRPILRLRIDRPDSEPGQGVTVDECARVSRALESELDEREDLADSYILEVSSPGVERPLRRRRDFERSIGREVALRGYAPLVADAKRVEGVLVSVEGAGDEERLGLRLSDGSQVEVPTSSVAKANLVFRWKETSGGKSGKRKRKR